MKNILIAFLIVLPLLGKAQAIIQLNEVGKQDTLMPGYGIIYGNFIQRFGFKSGGFPQHIRLVNMESKQMYALLVKKTFRSSKDDNPFCYYIPPGKYEMANYFFTESKWYGGKMFTEQIFKDDNTRFIIVIAPNELYYAGSWHFDKPGDASFTDDKALADEKAKSNHPKIRFEQAKTALPQ